MLGFSAVAQQLDLPWQTWGPQAVLTATDADRPLLICCGCDSDHWSAQLLRELAADDEARSALAELCVPVAVSVAAHPGLAARVQLLLSLRGASGWPAIAFALPDGRLVGAIPYAPIRDGSKRVGVLRVAFDVASQWREQPADLIADAEQFSALTDRLADGADPRGLPPARLCLDAVEAAMVELADELQGGFGPAPRQYFPAILEFLTQRASAEQAPAAVLDHLTRALDALMSGAGHDHIGGGFFHAVQDVAWRRPFADKRLADNARMVIALVSAASVCQRPVYRAIAAHAIEWVRHSLRAEAGWYHAVHADSPAADGQLVEGAVYAWSVSAMRAVIGQAAADVVSQRLLSDPGQAIDDAGEWRIPAAHGDCDQASAERLPEWCRRLAVARSERPQPERCEVIYAHEQGVWLRALALAIAQESLHRSAAAPDRDASNHDELLAWQTDAGALAERLQWTIDELAADDVRALATIGRGLVAWSQVSPDRQDAQQARAAAETCAERLRGLAMTDALAVAVDSVLGPVFDPTDLPDAPAVVAEVAGLWLDLAELGQDVTESDSVSSGQASAQTSAQPSAHEWYPAVTALLDSQSGFLRAAPASCVGLATAWDRLLAAPTDP